MTGIAIGCTCFSTRGVLMKSHGFERYICFVVIMAMIVSGMCFANSKADATFLCDFIKENDYNTTERVIGSAEIGNQGLLRSANLASTIRENKKISERKTARLLMNFEPALIVLQGVDVDNALEYYELFEETTSSSVIIKFIQRQDGKKSKTTMI